MSREVLLSIVFIPAEKYQVVDNFGSELITYFWKECSDIRTLLNGNSEM